jgi:U5 small nuclear ribonucleoprotein component
MMKNPNLVRNVSVVGHLHHGKTTFMDMLLEQTHDVKYQWFSNDKQLRYTDTRLDEQEREVSIKAVPMSLVMPSGTGKHLLFNMMDTPGHCNFSDEVTASYRLSDGVLLLVDAVEGLMCNTERLIKHAASERLPICVFINKIDRLILELKLPPADAYHKLRHTLEEVNAVIEAAYGGGEDCPFADPVKGTVCFGSALYGWSFTLESFARLYAEVQGVEMDTKQFARRLWGDTYFHDDTRVFRKKPPPGGGERSFVQFILEPLYKIYSQAVGEHPVGLYNLNPVDPQLVSAWFPNP